jgi:UDP-GlcNAc:undecaprenyl-phosphate GlcNAc-1-phosphate transferase
MPFAALVHHAAAALVLVAIAAGVAWAMATRAPLVDLPNARSSHVKPTPRGGGIGILVAFGAGLIWLRFGAGDPVLRDPAVAGLVAGALVMGAAGLADDIRALSFAVKLAAQIAAAALTMAAGLTIDVLYVPGVGPVELSQFGPALTLLWLVGLTNAFNFMDGLDGLAGGTAALAGAFLCAAAIVLGDPTVAVLALMIAAASAGFLALNFPPARIFMGDVGSQFLGFAFAALGVLLARRDATGTFVFIVPLLLFNVLFDTLFTAARRIVHGENPTAPHRSHLYQLLNRSGFSHLRVALWQYLLVVTQGAGALGMTALAPERRWLVFLPFAAGHAIYAAGTLRLFYRSRPSIY